MIADTAPIACLRTFASARLSKVGPSTAFLARRSLFSEQKQRRALRSWAPEESDDDLRTAQVGRVGGRGVSYRIGPSIPRPDEAQVAQAEVLHGPRSRADVLTDLRLHQDDGRLRRGSRKANRRMKSLERLSRTGRAPQADMLPRMRGRRGSDADLEGIQTHLHFQLVGVRIRAVAPSDEDSGLALSLR